MTTTGLPVTPATVLLIAALNPVVIAVALAMGRRADQPQKLVVAGFAAAVAGVALLWLGAELRIEALAKPARAAAGIFVVQLILGTFWAWVGYRFWRRE